MRSLIQSRTRMGIATLVLAVSAALVVVWLNPAEAKGTDGKQDARHSSIGRHHGFGAGFGFAAGDKNLPRPTAAQRKAFGDDLKAAFKLQGAARTAALKAIQTKAAAGTYGAAIKAGAAKMKQFQADHPNGLGGFGGLNGPGGRHGHGFDPARGKALAKAFIAFLPQALQDDLAAAQAAPMGQRMAKYKAIMTKALAGDYGDKVTELAKQLKGFGGPMMGLPSLATS